jgi:hypothetical protein
VYAEGPFSDRADISYTIEPTHWLNAYAEGPILRADSLPLYAEGPLLGIQSAYPFLAGIVW